MFIRPRLPDCDKDYWEIYQKARTRMEAWPKEKLLCFLAGFSLVKRILMRIVYYSDAPVYQAAKDILSLKR